MLHDSPNAAARLLDATLPELARSADVPLPDFSMRYLDGRALAEERIIAAFNAVHP
jgi:hypothetical protein